MGTLHRARPILDIDKNNTVSVTSKTKEMNTGLGSHPGLFATPSPTLAALMAQAAVVEAAEVLAQTRAKGTAAARDVQRGILVGMLESECSYVQTVADMSPTPKQAVATILAAGLDVAAVGTRYKAILTVTQRATPGYVALSAYAAALGAVRGRKCSFNWQYTADGGKTFVTLPSTPRARTTAAGLTALVTYGFRVSMTGSDGVAGEWSQIVSFLVVR